MLRLRRFSVCALTAVVVFLGGNLVYAITLGSNQPDPSANVFVEYIEACRESGEVEALQEQMGARRTVKTAIAHELLEYRLSLAEAISQFRDLSPEGVDQWMIGRTDDERLGLCVIRWVKLELHNAPDRAAKRIPELDAELERYLQQIENERLATTTDQ